MEQRKQDLHGLEPPRHDRTAMARVHYLMRLESLINVGCKFRPDDLPASVWDELIAMALERAFVDKLVDQQREKHRREDTAMSKARAATGTPPPGQTMFKTSKPFR